MILLRRLIAGSTLRHACGAITTVGMATLLIGCTSTTSDGVSGDLAAQEEGLQVVTTFLPMTNFTQAVAGDRAQVTQLLPLNADPHDYQAKPQDAQRLADADVLIENGLGFESFLSDLVANAANPDLVIVDASEGIEVISLEEGHAEAGHDHDNHDEEGHDDHDEDDHDDHDEEGHDEEGHDEEKSAEAGHDHGDQDPHVWLDPKKAIQQVENIRDALSAADPDGEAIYEANATDYIEQLQALDADITESLAPYAGKTFVTYHDFAGHFASSYGLEAEYLVAVPDGNAAPGDVLGVIEAAESSNLKTLLSEPGDDNGPLEAIADDLGVSVSVFDPLETSDSAELSPDYYLTVMNQNLDNLTNAFGRVES